jgi:hypothetical protein
MATQILAAKAGVYLAGRPTARFGFARVPWLMGTRGIGKNYTPGSARGSFSLAIIAARIPSARARKRAKTPGRQNAAAARATKFAEAVRPLIEEVREHLRAEGRSAGLDAIADELSRREIPSARGRRWSGQAVKNVLARARDDHQ